MSSVIVIDAMVRWKKLLKSNARVFLRSFLFKDADQIRYNSSSKKLGRVNKPSAGGLDSRAEI